MTSSSSSSSQSPNAANDIRSGGVETTHMVLPPDTNSLGTAFGGRIMEWMDVAAAIAAGRYAKGAVVTAAVDDLHFAEPIRLGDVVVIWAKVNFTGKTSMEVGVRVERENQVGERAHGLSGYFTFVAVSESGKPVPVHPLTPQTKDEIRRYRAAEVRRQRRLQLRKKD